MGALHAIFAGRFFVSPMMRCPLFSSNVPMNKMTAHSLRTLVTASAVMLALLVPIGYGNSVSGMSLSAEQGWSSNGFEAVSAGGEFACAVRSDGRLICWGNSYGPGGTTEAVLAGNSFVSVSAGDSHVCGLQADGAVLCDGWNRAAQDPPPAGPFQSISAGGNHNCGVRTDGVVECWGSDTGFDGQASSGKATPPAGLFRSVSAGGHHTCGIRTDGTAACWGSDEYGQSTPPKGAFASVSAG